MSGHRWVKVNWFCYHFCARCGLVALKNEATQRAIRAKCGADD